MAFLAGILAGLTFPIVPPGLNSPEGWASLAAVVAGAAYVRTPPLRWVLWAVAGLAYVLLRGALGLQQPLPVGLEGKDVSVTGHIVGLPAPDPYRVRFEFEPHSLRFSGVAYPPPAKLRISWYGRQSLQPGQVCELTVRLKRPHGMSSPGGFDYERWLFQHGIRATGYVRNDPGNECRPPPPGIALADIRHRVRGQFTSALDDSPLDGLLAALAVGDRSGISDGQWEVLRATGTSHLMAISGLHVGLVAALVFLLVRRLWLLAPRLILAVPAPMAAAVGAMAAAAGYAALAGFSVPTQRALVMVVAALLAVLLRRRTVVGSAWVWALAAVLVFDPLTPLSAGFWLSFAAVAVIYYAMAGRLRANGPWWRWGRVQWVVAVGLAPTLVLAFREVSLSAPLVNLLAVPWVGLVVVPMTLVAALIAMIAPELADWPVQLSALLMEPIWTLIEFCAATVPPAAFPTVPLWIIFAAAGGVGLLLIPRGVPVRAAGVGWILPLLFYQAPAPAPGQTWVTLLDVGEGLSAVVRTAENTLVFDAGARYRTGFDLGDAVVAPYLRAAGVEHIDTLVVSHGDNDHIGGVRHLLGTFPVRRILTGVANELKAFDAEQCRRGQAWSWDGVQFAMLHPNRPRSDNNGSCVLRVTAAGNSVLLPGDIEREAESALVRRYGQELKAEVLVAPHHGSKTSSSPAFLDAVRPQAVLFPVGYRNRYGFPHESVVTRFRRAGVRLWGTARDGAISVKLEPGRPVRITGHRRKVLRFWHSRVDTLGGWSAL